MPNDDSQKALLEIETQLIDVLTKLTKELKRTEDKDTLLDEADLRILYLENGKLNQRSLGTFPQYWTDHNFNHYAFQVFDKIKEASKKNIELYGVTVLRTAHQLEAYEVLDPTVNLPQVETALHLTPITDQMLEQILASRPSEEAIAMDVALRAATYQPKELD